MHHALLLLLALAAPACFGQDGLQSALQVAGDSASRILELTWVMTLGGGAIFVGTLALLAIALAGPPAWRARLAGSRWVVAAGVLFPFVTLTALLAYTLLSTSAMGRDNAAAGAARIEVTGELWWWRVRYFDAAGALLLETANELRIPAGPPVQLELRSADVIHSFWVPALAGKMDMIPGHVNRLRLQARAPGVYRGQCAEFCGAQHARMALLVVALPPAEYEAWLQAQRQPAAAQAADTLLHRGQAVFAERRCGDCHAVRGTTAAGVRGPDLTHLASRLTLGAATLPNTPQALADWITSNQHIKPENRMPAYVQLPQEDLRALLAYLGSLR